MRSVIVEQLEREAGNSILQIPAWSELRGGN
jgi:hypothetical protein